MSKKIAIIGAGINGCSTAYYLKKFGPSLDVTVYECKGVGSQSSGRSGGFLSREWNNHLNTLEKLSKFSYKLHKDLKRDLGVDVGYRDLQTYEVNVDFTSSERKRNKEIMWITHDSSDPVQIGTKETTSQVHPYQLCKAMVDASDVKVVICTVSELLFDANDSPIGLIDSEGRHYLADVIVVAVGPWCSKVSDWFLKSEGLFKFHSERGHSVVVEASLSPQSVFLFYLSDDDGRYRDLEIYPRPDGTVYACGYNDREPLPNNPADVTTNEESCQEIIRILGETSRYMKDVNVVRSGSCYIPWSDDHLPVVGKIPGYSNCYIAGGHGCWGILYGPGTGYFLACMIIGKDVPFDISELDISRFQS